ncbi:hypothetical protein N7481_007236 [Penicillium waksmanii]|uniref:uncharacterized protein n=1 Tax=Penicillium waksmanii TaxID=69791 RepID=UPI00254910FE|nr:uncharacterized protein N7481_007236 [Penicillium waksmanii]KAJ5979938.1 hypothetical protein N7481_007236 [Penicillium waksmanii]
MTTKDRECDSDSDLNEEFEDVPGIHEHSTNPNPNTNSNGFFSAQSTTNLNKTKSWTPTLNLPPQKPTPSPGSEEETQLRGRVSAAIERITYRQMKSEMGMDAPDTHVSHRRYENFAEFAADVDALIDLLWGSASPSIQTESLITLAGVTETALPTHPFDGPSALTLLHKFDEVFVALCTGIHPLTREPLREAQTGRGPVLVTQTQKVRIRSLAETTRYKVFSVLPVGEDDEEGEEEEGAGEQPWVLEATRVYDRTLMLLADDD